MSEKYTVFVYGTLKSGQPNHNLISEKSNGEAIFLGMGLTEKSWPLVVGPEWKVPYLLHAEGKGKQVKGEVYEVDAKMLKTLDELENHPKWYEREFTPVRLTSDEARKPVQSKEPVQVWCYFMKFYEPHMLGLPMLDCYGQEDHGMPHIPSKDLRKS